jgi:thiol-disulfide isomerase/thioredoxin
VGLCCPFVYSKEPTKTPDFSFTRFSDNKISNLYDYEGPIVVNYWAVWCPYCVSEMPMMNKVYEGNEKGFTIIAVAIDNMGGPKTFSEKKKYDWVWGLDKTGYKTYSGSGIPMTLFINKDKILVVKEVGEMSEKVFKKDLSKIL